MPLFKSGIAIGKKVIGGTAGRNLYIDTNGLLQQVEGVYIGDPTVNGNWALAKNGSDLAIQKRESGTFQDKQLVNP